MEWSFEFTLSTETYVYVFWRVVGPLDDEFVYVYSLNLDLHL